MSPYWGVPSTCVKQQYGAVGTPLSGNYDMTFNLYTVFTNGTAVWAETQTGVSVSGGVSTVEPGSVTPLVPSDFSEPLYLGVTVGTDDEMGPRLPVLSAGYAFKPSSYAKVAIVAKGGWGLRKSAGRDGQRRQRRQLVRHTKCNEPLSGAYYAGCI